MSFICFFYVSRRAPPPFSGGHDLTSPGPVSYTHLDVYKRQGEPVRINFERVLDAVRISGVRVIHNKQETEVSMNVCSESKICLLYTSRCV